jgi:hypothetical protein
MCIPYQVYRQAVVWMLASYKPRSAADGSYFLALANSSFCVLLAAMPWAGTRLVV